MKRLIAILFFASVLSACNSNSEKTTNTVTDSISSESPLMDAEIIADSANKIMHDSTGKLPDSLMQK